MHKRAESLLHDLREYKEDLERAADLGFRQKVRRAFERVELSARELHSALQAMKSNVEQIETQVREARLRDPEDLAFIVGENSRLRSDNRELRTMVERQDELIRRFRTIRDES